jgi:hypothetical protein
MSRIDTEHKEVFYGSDSELPPQTFSFSTSEYKQAYAATDYDRLPRPAKARLEDSILFNNYTLKEAIEKRAVNNNKPADLTESKAHSRRRERIAGDTTSRSVDFSSSLLDDAMSAGLGPVTVTSSDPTSGRFKATFVKRFNDFNRGFDDTYAKTKGEVIVKLNEPVASTFRGDFSYSGDAHKWRDTGDDGMTRSSRQALESASMHNFASGKKRQGKKAYTRNMFVSHIDSHLFPGK